MTYIYIFYIKLTDIPDCFHRIITSFNKIVKKGNVNRKLSIISVMSPQTRVSACTRGIIRKNVIKMKAKPTRTLGPRLLLEILSIFGHKPINSKLGRFNSIAHTKSLRKKFFI